MSELLDSEGDKAFVEEVIEKHKASLDATTEWREEAQTAFGYVSGDQWSDDDKASLEEQLRPCITFNRIEVFVSAVTGLEALNRQEVQYVPRQVGPINNAVSGMLSDAAKYVNNTADAEVHNSHAFRDMVTCGMGWTETAMNYEQNQEGDIDIERVDPLYMNWDPSSTQRNLADAKWVMNIKPMDATEVRERWPDMADDIEYSRIFEPSYEPENRNLHDANDAWKYEHDQSRRMLRQNDEIYVACYQWYEREMYYKVQKPNSDETIEMPAKQYKKLKRQYPEAMESFRAVGPIPKRKYKQAFIAGWTVLEIMDIPGQNFTFQSMTGRYDRNQNAFYGLVRGLVDPQDWLNKLFSQILHIINSNSKGGLIVEKGAVEHPDQFEDDWAKPDGIVYVRDGAISKGQIQQKQALQYPQGLDRLMSFASEMMPDVTGMSPELLGMANKVQPGVLEAQRKQAGMTMLSWAFDSLRAYRKRQGRVLATFIREFIADGRLIRITGQDNEEYIELMRDKLTQDYDIVVAESAQSTNERERTFSVIMQLLPNLINAGFPVPKELMDYLPIPPKMADEWKKQMENPQQQQAQQQEQQMMQAKIKGEIENKQADTHKKHAEAGLKEAQTATEPMKAIK